MKFPPGRWEKFLSASATVFFITALLEKNLRRWTERKYRSFSPRDDERGWRGRMNESFESRLSRGPRLPASFYYHSPALPMTPNSDGYPHKWRGTSKTLGYLPRSLLSLSPDKIRGSHALSLCRVQCSRTYLAVRLLAQLLLNYLQRSSVSKLRGVIHRARNI